MKNFKVIVVSGLCASLILNYILFNKLNTIDNKLNNISNYQHQIISNTNTQLSSINTTINKMKEEQRWISPVKVETVFDDADMNEVDMIFEWQVKELKNNSEVLFNYRIGEDREYTTIKPELKGSGVFRAVVPVEVSLEPSWNIRISNSNIKEMQQMIIEEKVMMSSEKNSRDFNYYISVSNGEMLKSSDINNARIRDVGAAYYGYLEVHTDIKKDNTYSVSVMNIKGSETSVSLKEVYLKKYSEDKLVGEEKLVEENNINRDGMVAREKYTVFITEDLEGNVYYNNRAVRENNSAFITEDSKGKMEYNRMVLKVVYSDGAVFERDVYTLY